MTPGTCYLPGISNLILAPLDVYYQVGILRAAIKVKDPEARDEAILRLLQNTLAFLGAAGTGVVYLKDLHALSSYLNLTPVVFVAGGLGLMLCALETAKTSYDLKNEIQFIRRADLQLLKQLKKVRLHLSAPSDQSIKAIEKLEAQINAHRDFFEERVGKQAVADLLHVYDQAKQLDPQEFSDVQYKTMQLAMDTFHADYLETRGYADQMELERRIMPWSKDQVKKGIEAIRADFLSSSAPTEKKHQALERGYAIIQQIRVQNKKKILLHMVSFLCIALTAASIITSFVLAPYIPLALAVLAIIVMCFRYLMARGWLEAEGWCSFRVSTCIPEFMKAIAKKIGKVGAYVIASATTR